jgi:transcriptional regulator with XRE-family HTH domain
MKEQINKIMEAEGMSPAKFADEIGVQRSSISHIISGRNKPSYDFIVKILERFEGINADWLLTGKGSMIKSSGYNIGAPSVQKDLFNQALNKPEVTSTKETKPTITTFENHNRKENVSENSLKDNSVDETVRRKNIIQFTNVNNINYVLIFYEDGTFEKYTLRESNN